MTEEVSYSRHFGVNDDYNIPQFARDDPRRFLELVEHLNPRDQEMLICYALEDRSRTFILAFAASCVLGSAYGFLQGAWPFGVLEAIWSLVAMRRWLRRRAAPV